MLFGYTARMALLSWLCASPPEGVGGNVHTRFCIHAKNVGAAVGAGLVPARKEQGLLLEKIGDFIPITTMKSLHGVRGVSRVIGVCSVCLADVDGGRNAKLATENMREVSMVGKARAQCDLQQWHLRLGL